MHQSFGATYGPLPIRFAIPLLLVAAPDDLLVHLDPFDVHRRLFYLSFVFSDGISDFVEDCRFVITRQYVLLFVGVNSEIVQFLTVLTLDILPVVVTIGEPTRATWLPGPVTQNIVAWPSIFFE